MPDSIQQPLTEDERKALLRVLSEPRFSTYMAAAGHDVDRAWRLYVWNAKIGQAFHFPIQCVEVSLRNCIDHVLTQRFGPNWGAEPRFESLLDDQGSQELAVVKKRIKNRRQQPVNGQIVAGLSFGFWVQMLHKRHYPEVWSRDLAYGFPHLPANIEAKMLHARAASINKLRNRISHHEPLINADISREYADILEFIGWSCPTTLSICKPHFTVGKVMRQKP